MDFRFSFYQWHPNSDIHYHADRAAVADKVGGDIDRLLQLWRRWLTEFPTSFKLVTMTTNSYNMRTPYVQLRFWFGEPNSIHHGYADSCGHNLIVHISGNLQDSAWFKLLRAHMVGNMPYTEEHIDNVEVWRITR